MTDDSIAKSKAYKSSIFTITMIVLGAVGLLGYLGARFYPDDEFPVYARNAICILLTAALIGLALLAYLAFGPGRFTRRLALAMTIVGTLIAIGFASIKRIDLNGDLEMQVRWRWAEDGGDRLARLSSGNLADDARGEKINTLSAKPTLSRPTVGPADYPGYRGADRTATIDPTGINLDWATQPPKSLWRQPIGGGYSQPIIVDRFVYTGEQRGENETIACYDLATGKEIWNRGYTSRFFEKMGGEGPRATPTFADGRLFHFGAFGRLTCLDAGTGEQLWQVDAIESTNQNLEWAMSGSPLIVGDRVIVNSGRNAESAPKNSAIKAYDVATGTPVWSVGDMKAGYASPFVAELAGRPTLIVFDGGGLALLDLKTGRELARHPWKTSQDINVAQPLVVDQNRIFITSGYATGCSLLSVERMDPAKPRAADGVEKTEPTEAEKKNVDVSSGDRLVLAERWRTNHLRCRYSSPVKHGDFIYGIDETGSIGCIEIDTGKKRWKSGRFGNGQLVLIGDRMLVTHENGSISIVACDPTKLVVVATIKGLAGTSIRTWNCPAVGRGKLVVRNDQVIECYELSSK
jgi:outer membrane protein assembly factor BamB